MEKMKLTENMVAVLTVLAGREEGKGFAREVLADARLKGKTFNGVNATLAAAAGKGLCTKAKGVFEDKMLTVYTITDAGRAVIAPEAEDEAGEQPVFFFDPTLCWQSEYFGSAGARAEEAPRSWVGGEQMVAQGAA